MTRYSFTATGPIRTRKDGEVAFADVLVDGHKVRIQTQAADADRPIFTVADGDLIAHNEAAVALIEGREEATARREAVIVRLRESEAMDLAASMTAIMEEISDEAICRRAGIVRTHADRIAAERFTDSVIAAYVFRGDGAASSELGFEAR